MENTRAGGWRPSRVDPRPCTRLAVGRRRLPYLLARPATAAGASYGLHLGRSVQPPPPEASREEAQRDHDLAHQLPQHQLPGHQPSQHHSHDHHASADEHMPLGKAGGRALVWAPWPAHFGGKRATARVGAAAGDLTSPSAMARVVEVEEGVGLGARPGAGVDEGSVALVGKQGRPTVGARAATTTAATVMVNPMGSAREGNTGVKVGGGGGEVVPAVAAHLPVVIWARDGKANAPAPAPAAGARDRAVTSGSAAAQAVKAVATVDGRPLDDDGAPLGRLTRWGKRVGAVVRTFQIWAFLFHVLIKLGRQKLVQSDEKRMSERRRKLGRYLCQAFVRLGPTFIKIGQLLSTRIDLLAKEYIEELRALQDNVPGFGGERAVQIIERELGGPVDELFDYFNETSLAAASLGQVHVAYLNGTKYAVKVQRPGLRELFAVDLKSIGLLASILDRLDPKLDGTSRDWSSIFRESMRVLYEEVDYLREGCNAERFSRNFATVDWVKAPAINWERSSPKVLCMEFLEGIKISDVERIDAAGVDRPLLARRTAECYLAQLCRHGFFHCDPHPGNLACDPTDGGRIIFYDFGMMDELPDYLKRGLVNLIFGIYGNDVKEVCDALQDMDIVRKGADRMTIERVARFYLGEFQNTLQGGGKYINEMDVEEERRLARRERAKIGQDLFSGQREVPLQFPASFTFVFRAFTTLDGIGKCLNPAYDLTKIASPYLKELLDLKDGSVYTTVLKTWAKRLGWRGQDIASVVQSPRRVEHVDEVVTKLEQGELKLRVRVMESEAAFSRIEAVQESLGYALLASLCLNVAVVLGPQMALGSRTLFVVSALLGVQIPVGYIKVWQMKRAAQNVRGFR